MTSTGTGRYERLAALVGSDVAGRWDSMSRKEKQETLAQSLANRQNLPTECVRCGAILQGLERSRIGLFNDIYGSMCNTCAAQFGDNAP